MDIISKRKNLNKMITKKVSSHEKPTPKKLKVIQNLVVRSILKLKYDTPSNIIHQEAFNKLNLLTASNQL
ncbi:hypothetical protein BpHYR1_014535 [Brachionus plicatilis]|uniref:Uncharacterized protein n=1 Tax=Brachionus plicatilis TaxID=10195 RepID=A0A3M7PZE3_BRAPC|nr:hypothetical protein BpHYR1_014535 [Brachionus plicatilis]